MCFDKFHVKRVSVFPVMTERDKRVENIEHGSTAASDRRERLTRRRNDQPVRVLGTVRMLDRRGEELPLCRVSRGHRGGFERAVT